MIAWVPRPTRHDRADGRRRGLIEAAEKDHVSVNQLLVAFIAEGLGHRRGLKAMLERAGRADVEAALAILDRAPDGPPDPGDAIGAGTGRP